MKVGNLLQWERTAGEPVEIAGYTVTPESQALSVRFPFGGYVWNRPAAVLVNGEDGQERIAVVDVTRSAQLTLFAAAALFLVVGWLLQHRPSQED